MEVESSICVPAMLLRNLLNDNTFEEHMAEAKRYIPSLRSKKQRVYIEVMLAYRNDDYDTMERLIKYNPFPTSVRTKMEELYFKGCNDQFQQNCIPLFTRREVKAKLAYKSTNQDPVEAYWDVMFQKRKPRSIMDYTFLAAGTGRSKEDVVLYMNRKRSEEHRRLTDPVIRRFIAEFERDGNEDQGAQPSPPEEVAPALSSRKRCQERDSESSIRQPRKQKNPEKVMDQVPPSLGNWIQSEVQNRWREPRNGAQTYGSRSSSPLENSSINEENQTVESIRRSSLAPIQERRRVSGFPELVPEPEQGSNGALGAPIDDLAGPPDNAPNDDRRREPGYQEEPEEVDISQFDSIPGYLDANYYEISEHEYDVGAYGAFDGHADLYGNDSIFGRNLRRAQSRRIVVKMEPVQVEEGLEITYFSYGNPDALPTPIEATNQEEPAPLSSSRISPLPTPPNPPQPPPLPEPPILAEPAPIPAPPNPPQPAPLPAVENRDGLPVRIGEDYEQLAPVSAACVPASLSPLLALAEPAPLPDAPVSPQPAAPIPAPPNPPQPAPLPAVENRDGLPARIGENYMQWSIAEMADWVLAVTKSEKCRVIIIDNEFDGTAMEDIATDDEGQIRALFPFWTHSKMKKAAQQMINNFNSR